MRKQRRKHSIIDKLDNNIRDAVEQMMQSNFTYAEIASYIRSHGIEISESSVQRHASSLNANVQTLRMAQENFRVIMEEVSKYPQLDTTEGIIRLLCHQMLEAIQKTSEESWESIEPEKLLRNASGLIRAAAYKNNMDIKNKDILEAGFEQVKTLVFESMAKERPDLYKDVTSFLAVKGEQL